MLAVTHSATLIGDKALPVTVEVNAGEKGDVKYALVGLADAAVKESLDRILSALSNAGYAKPRTHVTINLAPGDLRKEGVAFDLPIALGILAATGQMKSEILEDYLVAGELALSGRTRPIKGGLSMTMLAAEKGIKGVILPLESAEEACLVESSKVYAVKSLAEAIRFLSGQTEMVPLDASRSPYLKGPRGDELVDFSEVKGQANLRRAVEVAVAGGHNLLMMGPPGSGKSMVSKRIPTILPAPSKAEYLEILGIHSVAGRTCSGENRSFCRPFRAPHHTISDVGLLGGGVIPGPGEISLAHNGVLFLDELPEFKRSALEVLRQPLEDGQVTISRSAGKITLPSCFMLVAAMNPCPCGYLSDPSRECRCSTPQIQKYRARVSGPLLDRIDIHIEAPAVRIEELQERALGESSETVRQRVEPCRRIQFERFADSVTRCNSGMSQRLILEHCRIGEDESKLLRKAMEELSLSGRAYDRILKVSRTIADLANSSMIQMPHLLEAIQYRNLDRSLII